MVLKEDEPFEARETPHQVFANDIDAQAELQYLDPDHTGQYWIEEVEYIH
jgi:hypothetical protein